MIVVQMMMVAMLCMMMIKTKDAHYYRHGVVTIIDKNELCSAFLRKL